VLTPPGVTGGGGCAAPGGALFAPVARQAPWGQASDETPWRRRQAAGPRPRDHPGQDRKWLMANPGAPRPGAASAPGPATRVTVHWWACRSIRLQTTLNRAPSQPVRLAIPIGIIFIKDRRGVNGTLARRGADRRACLPATQCLPALDRPQATPRVPWRRT